MSSIRSSQKILDFLKESQLGEGDQLPAEIDLAKVLGLSRNTIREAYARLTARGVLVRKHGIGTFVAKAPIINDFDHQRGFWRMIEASGYTPILRVLSQSIIAADDSLGAQIRAPQSGPLTRLEWLFLADARPVIFIQHVLAPSLQIQGIDWQTSNNLLAALADQINPQIAELEVLNTAVNAPVEIAKLLDVRPGAALMHGVSKVHAGADYVPVVSRHWSNPEYFTIMQRGPISHEQFSPYPAVPNKGI